MKIWITKIILFFIIATKLFGQDMIIFQPSMNIGLENWRIVNDDVMGGISKSYISLNDENNMLFNGYLSLENRGGFASCRNSLSEKIPKDTTKFKIRVKGDGRTYQFRLRMRNTYANYAVNFKTIKNEWIDVEISMDEFKAYIMGARRPLSPKLKAEKISSIGFLLADKKEGNFGLEIMHVIATKEVAF